MTYIYILYIYIFTYTYKYMPFCDWVKFSFPRSSSRCQLPAQNCCLWSRIFGANKRSLQKKQKRNRMSWHVVVYFYQCALGHWDTVIIGVASMFGFAKVTLIFAFFCRVIAAQKSLFARSSEAYIRNHIPYVYLGSTLLHGVNLGCIKMENRQELFL